MKTICTIIFAIVLTCNLVAAQDTLYIYKSGAVVTKRAVTDIDSVIFYKAMNPATIADIDGNVYHTVKIGTQEWMVENLKTTKYNDGTVIPVVTSASAWNVLTSPAYCWYNNNADNKNTYGALYNWYTIKTGKLAPKGWHVPTDAEWTMLEIYLQNNGYNWDGSIDTDFDRETNNNIAKSLASTTNWTSSTSEGVVGNTDNSAYRNKSGFSGLPSGCRDDFDAFDALGSTCFWWSSTENGEVKAWYRYLYYSNSNVNRRNYTKQEGFSVRCIKGDSALVLGVTIPITTEANNITITSASCGGYINYDGGSLAVSASGVCWNTTGSPTTADNKTTDGTLVGPFTSTINGLTANTTYYVRAWATNNNGTGYGNEVSFKTYGVVDIENNGYYTLKIGTQEWMVENLKTTKYNDSSSIPLVSVGAEWGALTTPGYCFFNNDASNKNTYGALYNWYTVNTGKLAPTGWHVPTDTEWTMLENYLIANGYNYDGTTTGNKIAKSLAATTSWNRNNVNFGTIGYDLTKNNTSGFTALPGGGRYYDGTFIEIGSYGHWWSSTEYSTTDAWNRYLGYNYSTDLGRSYNTKSFGFSVRCVKGENISTPTLNTNAVTNLTTSSVTSGGNITSNGGATITVSGVCWSISTNPTTSDSITTDGTPSGSFASSITGLSPGVTYYVRAYATNSEGTAYGNQVSFNTSISSGTVTDIDGNVYHTVTIGTQVWMLENLKTTKYNDGTSIPLVSDDTAWLNLTTPGYCSYNNDTANKSTYGALYNWYTVNTGKLAPSGWHVATDDEWTTLENYLIENGFNYDGSTTSNNIAKSLAATTDWATYTGIGSIGNDLIINNTSGFTALPGGYRFNDGTFDSIGYYCYWWSSTEYLSTGALDRYLYYNYGGMYRLDATKSLGFSVRCVKD